MSNDMEKYARKIPVGSLWVNAVWKEDDGSTETVLVVDHFRKPNDDFFWFRYLSVYDAGTVFNDYIRSEKDFGSWCRIFKRIDVDGSEHGETHDACVVRQSELTP